MTKSVDAIIIGTGVIGAAVAFELSKIGLRCLSLDRNTQSGHGSTAGSCAIIRMHYSTYAGTAFAWEGYHYWRDWADYLGIAKQDLARFIESGCLVMKTSDNDHLKKHMKNSASIECPFEEWSAEKIRDRLPIYSLNSYAPAKHRSDPDFGRGNGADIRGGVYWPNAGYVTDPALSAQNLMAAAQAKGAQVRLGVEVMEILQTAGRVTGVKLSNDYMDDPEWLGNMLDLIERLDKQDEKNKLNPPSLGKQDDS